MEWHQMVSDRLLSGAMSVTYFTEYMAVSDNCGQYEK